MNTLYDETNNLLDEYIIKDIKIILLNYIFEKCNLCGEIYENLVKCIGCIKMICDNCIMCQDCYTIYSHTNMYIDNCGPPNG
jgi:hypothetical protein